MTKLPARMATPLLYQRYIYVVVEIRKDDGVYQKVRIVTHSSVEAMAVYVAALQDSASVLILVVDEEKGVTRYIDTWDELGLYSDTDLCANASSSNKRWLIEVKSTDKISFVLVESPSKLSTISNATRMYGPFTIQRKMALSTKVEVYSADIVYSVRPDLASVASNNRNTAPSQC